MLSVGKHRITVPAGAVSRPIVLTLTVPASNDLRIDATANDHPHFGFARPASLTISYAGCSGQALDPSLLRAWYIDGRSGRPIQEMRATVDEEALTITFPVRHLSTYAVAY
jgi:hypothetical protein